MSNTFVTVFVNLFLVLGNKNIVVHLQCINKYVT